MIRPDITITILRDPVERAISALRQIQGVDGDRPRPLEQIYDEDPGRWKMVQNYQVRQFAMSREVVDEAAAVVETLFPGRGAMAADVPHFVYIDIDDALLARAIEHLHSVQVVGLQDSYHDLLDELRAGYGWGVPKEHRMRVQGEGAPVSEALRRRIVADGAADIEFYAEARRLVASRRR